MQEYDLRKIPCPRNTSKALIRLSTMDSGEELRLLLDDGEPIQNVPSSLILEGHEVISKEKNVEGYWVVIVRAG